MRRSIATVCLSGTLEDKLDAAARAGFDEVELFEPDLIASAMSPECIRDRAADLGLDIGLYQPFRDFEAVPDLTENLRRAEHKLAVMERLGADLMLVCSNVSDQARDDDDLAAEQLSTLADRAAERGIRIAYEALAWGRHVRDYEHAWRIVAQAGHPSLGTCLDSFHVLSRPSASDPANIRAIPGEKIFYLQLADAPELVMDVLQWSRHYRCFPGQGGFDLPAFLQHVLATGYDGPLSLEVFNDVFRQADPERMAVDAMRSLRLLEEAAGVTALPQAAPLSGYAFVELAVGPEAAAPVERLLIAMGFRHAGHHRSKPVQLWRHGDTRILVNHDGGDDPRVAAIAVESADPVRSADRAQHLLAPLLPRDRGPGEADLSAIAAPDGTSVFFCRTDGGGWLTDFLTAGPPGNGVSPDVIGIDHVALSQPFDYFDEASLFYRSVLGLELQPPGERATAEGLIRSREAQNADGTVRFSLSVPVVGSNDFELQHVALASDDVLAAAEAMRGRGVPLLAVHDNYYDDLLARTALDPDVVERLRSLDVRYDHGLLHFYTEPVGPGLRFEVVQRT